MRNVLLVWSFSLLAFFANAQSVEETAMKADSLLKYERYLEADVLYDRICFFADTTQLLNSLDNAAICKAALGKWNDASAYYGLLSKLIVSDSAYYETILKQALCLVLDKQFGNAERLLKEIQLMETRSYFKQKSYFLSGVIASQQFNYSYAKTCFDSAVALLGAKDSTFIYTQLMSEMSKMNSSANRSAIYSAIVPGLGQLTQGEFKSGINSFILNAGLISAFVYTGIQYHFFTSFLFYSAYLPRFYLGGISNTKNIARNRKIAQQQQYLNSYLSVYLTH